MSTSDKIPFVVIFNTNKNGDKINDDIYDCVKNENELDCIIANIIKKLIIDNKFIIMNKETKKYELDNFIIDDLKSNSFIHNESNTKLNINNIQFIYELFCQKINGEPYNTNNLFEVSYFINNEWFAFDSDDLHIIFHSVYSQFNICFNHN